MNARKDLHIPNEHFEEVAECVIQSALQQNPYITRERLVGLGRQSARFLRVAVALTIMDNCDCTYKQMGHKFGFRTGSEMATAVDRLKNTIFVKDFHERLSFCVVEEFPNLYQEWDEETQSYINCIESGRY